MKTKPILALAAILAAAFTTATAKDATPEFTVHEWGTFTSVIGSDGTHLDGVHREDAPLPDFVYHLDPASDAPRRTKGLAFTREFAKVNVRLETPVIYFYTDETFDVQVDVGFQRGTISQWFPQRSAGEKRAPSGRLAFDDFSRKGHIRWNVKVEPAGEDQIQRVFRPGELPCWLYPRYPDSALVTNKEGETEKYLFYRGLGHMNLPNRFESTDTELKITHPGKRNIVPPCIIFDNQNGHARWWISAETTEAPLKVTYDSKPYAKDWRDALYKDGLKLLMDAGLFQKEADAMLQTWWDSYFETPGLRVFWIVPDGDVSGSLPITIKPAPKSIERVIVGRCEILRPSFEQQLVSDFAKGEKTGKNPWASDRFFPAYASRVRQLAKAASAESTSEEQAVATTPEAEVKLPTQNWRVTFGNGVVQNCKFLASGKVTAVQPRRTAEGKAVVKGNLVEITYEDDRFERWTMKDGKMHVEHWHPSAAAAEGPGTTGTAEIVIPTGFNDRISSVRIGGNVHLVGYEDANFEGASITFGGGSNYPNLQDLNAGLVAPAHWNDRISSVRIVAGDNPQLVSAADNQVTLYQGGNYEAGALTLTAGTEIAHLVANDESTIRAALEVHEWGTFTMLQGSNGQPLQWYQAPEHIVDLPAFVDEISARGKAGLNGASGTWALAGMDTVRMETPVLYFYPDEQMDVTVRASYPQGRITEVFPPVLSTNSAETVWRGTLLPPDSPEREKVPAATGATGRHYGAARAVPDAWLFRNKPLSKEKQAEAAAIVKALQARGRPVPPKVEPIDHFIFYRGAGTGSEFQISAHQLSSPGSYMLSNNGATVPKLIAVQVHDGQTSWTTLTNLEKATWDREKRTTVNRQNFTFPAPAGPVEQVAEEIRKEMVATLHTEGLTQAEAEAMVATWDNLWFTEPGTRVLAVLPQSVADAMVPLKITPVPEKIDRVFVARLELISREQEALLMSVLNAPNAGGDLEAATERLASVKLGRYTAGGMERAKTLVAGQIQSRYYAIEQFRQKQANEKKLALQAEAKKQAAVSKQ